MGFLRGNGTGTSWSWEAPGRQPGVDMGEVRGGLFLWSRSSWQRSEEPAEGSHVVGGSSRFHSLCGLFVIPRNKADQAGLRVGRAVCSGLHAFTPLLPLPVPLWHSEVGMPLYAHAPQITVLSSQCPQLESGFSFSFLRPRRNWLSLAFKKTCCIAQAGL